MIAEHPDRDAVKRFISKAGKRTFILSMLTAAEVLRIPDEKKRELIFATIGEILDPGQALIGPPMYVLEQPALARRRGESLVRLEQEEQGLRLKERILDPLSLTADDIARLATWIDGQKGAFARFWQEVSRKSPVTRI